MSLVLKSVLTTLLFIGCTGDAATLQSFVAGLPVRPVGDALVQQLELPEAVYRGVQCPDLGDLRVFNANGDEVPHALLRDDVRATETRDVPLRFFLVGAQGESTPETLRLQLEQADTTLDLTLPTASPEGAAYLLDTSDVEGTLTALRLEWPERTDDFLTTLIVKVSDDLQTWRTVTRSTAAQLQRGETRLERATLSLPPITSPYLRLRPQGGDTLPPLSRVTATLTSQSVVQTPLRTLALTPTDVAANRYTFRTGGAFQIERARLQLPQTNMLVRAELLSSTSPDGPWTRHYTGLRYRLTQNGQDLTAPPMTFAPTSDPYWQLRVGGSGGGLGSGEPGLELDYRPDTLLFLTRGAGPYTLAYGNPAATSAAFEPSELLQALPNVEVAALPQAEAGTPVTLGGLDALRETRPFPWSQVLLWGVLVLGVGVLGWLAFGLLRQLDSSADGEAD